MIQSSATELLQVYYFLLFSIIIKYLMSKANKSSTSPPKNQPSSSVPQTNTAASKNAPAPAKNVPAPAKNTPAQPAKNAPAPPAPAKGKFDAKTYAKNGVSEEEVNAIKNAFDLFDTDQGGSIDIKELKAAMISLGFQSKNGAIFQMVADLDSDGNGTIDFEQWFSLMTKRVNDRDSRANINKIFALFDDQRTGYISIKNLRRVAQELGENIPEEELQELITRADTDQDGLVSEEEFYVILTRKIKD